MTQAELGIIASEDSKVFPFGKQSFFFEDMLNQNHQNEISVFMFSPHNWNQETNIASGYRFMKNYWIKSEELIPNLIFDRAYSTDVDEKKSIEDFRQFLIEKNIQVFNPFALTELLQNKLKFHYFLETNNLPTLTNFTITHIKNERFWDRSKRYYLKPILGSKGEGVFVMEFQNKFVILYDNMGQEKKFESYSEFLNYFEQTINLDEYFLQEEAKIIRYNKCPFDLRVLVQNNGYSYNITGMGLRVGKSNSMVANLNSGGVGIPIEEFRDFYITHYERNFEADIDFVKKICLKCTNYLHNNVGEFLEIGYDILFTKEGPIILEGNSKPSRGIFNSLAKYAINHGISPEYYKNLRNKSVIIPLEYAKYLLKKTI